jgi:hypothetical protein
MHVVLSIVFLTVLGLTQKPMPVDLGREFQILRHNVNQVEMCISNYGKFGQDESGMNAGCWWPIGTNHNYIRGAGIWFGTVDSLTGDTLVTTGFDPCDWTSSECAPGLHGMPVNHPEAIIYMYPNPWLPPVATFPMAPQDLVSHQDSWCVYNDCDSVYHNPGDTRPIGIEIYQTVYAWDSPGLEDMIFFLHDVKNVTGHTLQQCYIGIAVTCQIGYSDVNDRCCAIVEREYIVYSDTITVDNIGYQWQLFEEPGTPNWWPGTIGFDLLQTPFDLVEGMDKDGDGILDQYERDSAYYVNNLPNSMWDVDNDGVPDWRDPSQWPQLGMTAFKRFSFPRPDTDAERFLTMAGYDYNTGQYEPFDTIPSAPGDWWVLVESSGPFNLLPDSTVTLIFAVMFADWFGIYYTPDTALALIDKWAEDYYNMYWYLYTGIEENFELRIANCEMRVTPNPISHSGTVSFSLPTATDGSLKLYNIAGQLVSNLVTGRIESGHHTMRLDTGDLPQGAYFLVLEAGDFSASRSVIVLR